MEFSSISLTDVGRVRSANEDSYGEANTPNGYVYVVCDGMGGHVGGATASGIAVSSVLEYFSKDVYDNLIQALDRALIFANEQVYARAVNDVNLKGMGTTALVLLIKGNECYIGHVGDSRIYLKSDGKLNRLTKDHSFVQNLVDSGVISDEDAESHPNKNQILKALGISPNLEPTICQSPILPKKGDVFMLCSDGMNGMVNDQSMEMMINSSDINLSTQTLIRAALDAGGNDNVTVTLVGITSSPHTTSQFKHFNPITKFDASSTNTINITETPKNKQKNNVWLYAGIVLILVLVGLFTFNLVNIKTENKKDITISNEILTLEKLQNWPVDNIHELMGRRIQEADSTYPACNNTHEVMVKDEIIIKISEKPEQQNVKEEGHGNNHGTGDNAGKNTGKTKNNRNGTGGGKDNGNGEGKDNGNGAGKDNGTGAGKDNGTGAGKENENNNKQQETDSSSKKSCSFKHTIKKNETVAEIIALCKKKKT